MTQDFLPVPTTLPRMPDGVEPMPGTQPTEPDDIESKPEKLTNQRLGIRMFGRREGATLTELRQACFKLTEREMKEGTEGKPGTDSQTRTKLKDYWRWKDGIEPKLKAIETGEKRGVDPNSSEPVYKLNRPTAGAGNTQAEAVDGNDSAAQINFETSNMQAKNSILYGPPGTGKTFTTIDEALKIVARDFYEDNKSERESLKKRFDELVADKRIRFVTFHQSFSYEDFVEGLRAETDEDAGGQIKYVVGQGVFKAICEDASKHIGSTEINSTPYVLIIDEINRGNVSRIFGELITLIEPSKRLGAPESLTVTLPYSKNSFGVPQNVYLIGTMNTADKSLTGLDIALRRRFVFKEMPPKPELLDKVIISGLSVSKMLRAMNQRIEVLLDRDHCIGHAYFLPLKQDPSIERLSAIFKQQVLPLLQEYFFEDWEHIRWVLNDHRTGGEPFIKTGDQGSTSLEKLFGSKVASELRDKRWSVNEAAFTSIGSYINIVGASE